MKKPISYLQTDARWAYNDYSVPGKEKTNIYVSGCAPTSAAMVIASLKDKSVTPATCAAWSVKHGYKAVGAGTYNTFFVPMLAAYGIKATYLSEYCYHNLSHKNHAKVKAALKSGKWVIANAGPGLWTSGGHFILAYGIDNSDNVYINDPASTKATRLKNSFNTFAYQMKYYWIIDVPESYAGTSKPAASGKNYIAYGDKGAAVSTAQKILKDLGYYTGNIDGSFGPLMQKAVEKVQKAMGLKVDGSYGPETKKAVENVYKNRVVTSNPYKVGSTYVLKYDVKVRDGAGTSSRWKKYSQLTSDGKKHAYSTNSYAVLKAGTQVSVLEVKSLSNSEIWIRIPSGWIAAVYGGCFYIK